MKKGRGIVNRERAVSSMIVALVGLFYIFAPHEIHVASQVDFGLSHAIHIVLGIILVGVSAYYVQMKPPKPRAVAGRKRKRSVSRKKSKRRRRKKL